MTSTRHADFRGSTANLDVIALPDETLTRRGITKSVLGVLALPTGTIVVADPVVMPERPALARNVEPGSYPVTLYRAQRRVALAELRFAPGAPSRWQIALIPGQDAGTLKDGEIFGYPVDAGLGSFMDVEGVAALDERDEQEKARRGRTYISLYDDVVAEPLGRNGDTELLFQPLPERQVNIAIFQSGWGDGFYPSYWGLDQAGKPLVLVTDFGVLDRGDGRSQGEITRAAIVASMTPEQRRDSADGYAALKSDDLETLASLVRQGRVTPETHVEEAGDTLTFEAIRLDKPEALALFVRHDAPIAMPGYLHMSNAKTYPDYARVLNKPRSAELQDVIAQWEGTRSGPDPSKR